MKQRKLIKPVDILFATHQYELYGGAELSLLMLMEYLSKQGLIVHVLVGGVGTFTKELKRFGIGYSLVEMPFWAHGPQDHSSFSYPSTATHNRIDTIVNLLDKLKPKLCVTNTMVIPWLAYGAAISGLRHAWIIRELGGADHGLKFALGPEKTLRTVEALSDKIFCNSKFTASYFEKQFKHQSNIGIIYPEVSLTPTKINKSPFLGEGPKLILVGQIKPSKGQLDAVKAIKELSDQKHSTQLILVGAEEDKVYTQKIKDYIKNNDLTDTVTLVGHQPDPATYVQHADIVLVCSSNEAFGRVTLEGMLQAKPVIGANSGGTAEIIADNETGLLYKPGNVKDLSNKIKKLTSNKVLAIQVGKAAYAHATSNYSSSICYADFMSYYYNLTGNPNYGLDLSPMLGLFNDHNAEINALNVQVKNRDNIIKEQAQTINDIISSKAWKLAQALRRSTLK